MTDDGVLFYYREGCHLCEQMAARLFSEWPQVAEHMQWCDIDSRDAWAARFGQRVPVLMKGPEVVSEYFLDPGRMRAHFGPPANPI